MADWLRHNAYMHYLTCLAVEAENASEAMGKVDAFLERYLDVAFDWYVIGGRWSGLCGGEDYVCAGERRSVFDDIVERASKAQTEHFNQIRQNLVGPDPRVPVGDGFPIQPSEGSDEHTAWVERVWEGYSNSSRMFNRLLNETKLGGTEEYYMIGYYLKEMADLIRGGFQTHSYFYDTVADSNQTQQLYERVTENPQQQWIVVVDLHN